jgi:hypothetical protein
MSIALAVILLMATLTQAAIGAVSGGNDAHNTRQGRCPVCNLFQRAQPLRVLA